MAVHCARITGAEGLVVLTETNAAMLTTGRGRLLDQDLTGNLLFAQVNAKPQPFPDDHFDCVTIGFGMRNVPHKRCAVGKMQARESSHSEEM